MSGAIFQHQDAMRLIDGIGDPIRLEIVQLLAGGKAMNVGEITTRFRVSRPAISHHLKVLKDAGIVRSEKTGQEVYYCLDRNRIVAGLRGIADTIEMCCDSWKEENPEPHEPTRKTTDTEAGPEIFNPMASSQKGKGT
jgi:ArsR family transcriptional regulator, arsenate/arsenite/antimonite-responsive transcriptional repressor